jgi:nucleotide-binding universal stress UspA family protein
MFSRILIAVDPSEPAKRVVQMGGQLACAAGAAVKVLHVVHPIPPFIVPGTADERPATGEAQRWLDTLADQLPTDVAAERLVLHGVPAEQIVAAARDWNADLVIVGDHNRHILSRFLLGSVADAVVRHAPCSVLVARAKDQPAAA